MKIVTINFTLTIIFRPLTWLGKNVLFAGCRFVLPLPCRLLTVNDTEYLIKENAEGKLWKTLKRNMKSSIEFVSENKSFNWIFRKTKLKILRTFLNNELYTLSLIKESSHYNNLSFNVPSFRKEISYWFMFHTQISLTGKFETLLYHKSYFKLVEISLML